MLASIAVYSTALGFRTEDFESMANGRTTLILQRPAAQESRTAAVSQMCFGDKQTTMGGSQRDRPRRASWLPLTHRAGVC